MFCGLQPCLGPVKTRAKNAKLLFPPIMAYISEWASTRPANAVFHPGLLKNQKFPKLIFFDILTTQCDYPRCVKHVFGRIDVFFTLFAYCVGRGGGGGGGSPKGLLHNLLMQFFTLDCSKIEVLETYFFDIVTTQYDHPSMESMF